jgi:hypothetical protein
MPLPTPTNLPAQLSWDSSRGVRRASLMHPDLIVPVEEREHLPRNRTMAAETDRFAGLGFSLPTAPDPVAFSTQSLNQRIASERVLSETHRALRPPAVRALATPFFWPETELPHDDPRFTSLGLDVRFDSAVSEDSRTSKPKPRAASLFQVSIGAAGRHVWRRSSCVLSKRGRESVRTATKRLSTVPDTAGSVLASAFLGRRRNIDAAGRCRGLGVSAKDPLGVDSAVEA